MNLEYITIFLLVVIIPVLISEQKDIVRYFNEMD